MKNILIVNCYIDSPQKEQILYDCLLQLKKTNHDILLVANSVITSDRVLRLCNHHIYNDDNFLLPKENSPYIWYSDGQECVNVHLKGIAYVIVKKLNLSLHFVKNLDYDKFLFMEFDNIFHDEELHKIDDIFNKLTDKKAFFCKFGYEENLSGFETIIFGGDVRFFTDSIPLPNSYSKWVTTFPYSGQATNVLERMFPIVFSDQMDKVEFVDTNIRSYFPLSQIDAFSFSKDIHIIENVDIPTNPLLFIVGLNDSYKIFINDTLVANDFISKGNWRKYYFGVGEDDTRINVEKSGTVVTYNINKNNVQDHSSGIRYNLNR